MLNKYLNRNIKKKHDVQFIVSSLVKKENYLKSGIKKVKENQTN